MTGERREAKGDIVKIERLRESHDSRNLLIAFLSMTIPPTYKRFISREEFMGEAPKRQPEPESAEKRAERAFKVFDKNHDGFVTKDEMLRLCKNLSKEQARTN